MTGRRAVFGLCMLCALAFSALAAQSAGATTKGTTGFTCVKGKGILSGEHCLSSGGSAEYGHVAVAENTQTDVVGSNEKTASGTTAASPIVLKFTVAGTPLELRATGLQGSGVTENRKTESGDHYIYDEGATVFTGVTVAFPTGKGCKVFTDEGGKVGAEGIIDTRPMKVTTLGQGDSFKFEPIEGTTFAAFWITCNKGEVPEALEGLWTITGSMKAPADGATVAFNHGEITTENMLKAKGVKCGLEGKVTVSAKDTKAEDKGFTPFSVTTVETP